MSHLTRFVTFSWNVHIQVRLDSDTEQIEMFETDKASVERFIAQYKLLEASVFWYHKGDDRKKEKRREEEREGEEEER